MPGNHLLVPGMYYEKVYSKCITELLLLMILSLQVLVHNTYIL
mgnify:FL=1